MCVAWLGVTAASAAKPAADIVPAPDAEWPASAARTLRELVTLAGTLVERAASASAPAMQYRIDSVYFRETLRDLVLANRQRGQAEQLPPAMLNDMVRMAALVAAAAECQTGRNIVCPADLILRLRSQHARVSEGLRAVTGKV